MKCADIEKYLSESIDNTLSDEQRVLVQEHLSACGQCREKAASMEAIKTRMAETPCMSAPPGFLDDLHKRLEAESSVKRFFKTLLTTFQLNIPVKFAAAAAMGVLVFFLIQTPEMEQVTKQASMPFPEKSVKQKAIYKDPSAGTVKKESMISMGDVRKVKSKLAEQEIMAEAPAPAAADDMEPESLRSLGNIKENKIVSAGKEAAPNSPLLLSKKRVKNSAAAAKTPRLAGSEKDKSIQMVLVVPQEPADFDSAKMRKRESVGAGSYGDVQDAEEQFKGFAAVAEKSDEKPAEIEGRAVPMAASEPVARMELSDERFEEEKDQAMKAGHDVQYDHKDPFERVKAAVLRVNGRILPEGAEDKKTISPLQVEIPAEQYNDFIEHLSAIGVFETSPPQLPGQDISQDTGMIRIDIHLDTPRQ